MDYEKKYKQALNLAKSYYENHEGGANQFLDTIFPELRESDDERIRKTLKSFFDSEISDYGNVEWRNGIMYGEIVAWLEKQREQKYDVPKTPIKDSESVTSRMKYIDDNLKPIAEFIIGYANWDLRKDEWNHPVATVPLFRVLDALVQNGNQYSEEYPVVDNNIEPKFKVGDWVVFKNRHQSIYQVEKIEDGYYILRHTHGGTFRVCLLHDKELRLWTINDAKDGDVITIGNEYFLFKQKKDTSQAVYISHCFADSAGAFRVTNGRDCGEFLSIENGITACPATKEQRDLLFKKISEAGYEWDSNTKQLTKKQS